MNLVLMTVPSATATNSVPSNTNSLSETKSAAKQLYICPMHPDVVSDEPGKCPKCGMDLVPLGK